MDRFIHEMVKTFLKVLHSYILFLKNMSKDIDMLHSELIIFVQF